MHDRHETLPPEQRKGIVQFLDHDQYAFTNDWYNPPGWEWTHIVHLAPIDPARVLKYAEQHHSRVLFASSGAVYEGVNEYAEHKRAWEQECHNSKADVVTARLFTFSGEHLKNLYGLTRYIHDARKGKQIEIWGDGRTIRSYLYGADLGDWMWRLLFQGEGIYDVGSRNPVTMLEVAKLVAEVFHTTIVKLFTATPRTVYMPDTTRAEALGCKETVDLRTAIERMAAE
jgi:nucleoside-diphosphate-sugar epimerase